MKYLFYHVTVQRARRDLGYIDWRSLVLFCGYIALNTLGLVMWHICLCYRGVWVQARREVVEPRMPGMWLYVRNAVIQNSVRPLYVEMTVSYKLDIGYLEISLHRHDFKVLTCYTNNNVYLDIGYLDILVPTTWFPNSNSSLLSFMQ